MNDHLPKQLPAFVRLYALVLALFMLFRLVLLLTQLDRLDGADAGLVAQALLMGLRFDIVIAGYILLLPFFIITVLSFTGGLKPWVMNALRIFLLVLFAIAFLACAVDIPYFGQFFQRLSITAFEWLDNPLFVFRMIVEEPRYWLAVIPFIGVVVVLHKGLSRIMGRAIPLNRPVTIGRVSLSLIVLGLVVLGIRGRTDEKSPIRVGTAYFSDHAFLNQLGLNPCFTLIRSWLDSNDEANRHIALMDDMESITKVQKQLGIVHPDPAHPLARRVTFDGAANPWNVVLVIMESMSAEKMARHGSGKDLTPFLDSLSHQGLYFDNAYSAGIHTFNGIFSTLFSFPALYRQHPMKESGMLRYNGLFSALRGHGYQTAYFTTHDGQFDNAEGFLRANDCERVTSKPDYPADQVKTTLGVPDDRMFAHALPILDDMATTGDPFVAVFMTASDHGPYHIPDHFSPKASDVREQATEFADWSLRRLIEGSADHAWMDNTLFVFVADHGAAIDGTYDLSLSYHHTPLLFYAPALIQARTDNSIAGQIDVFPTIMGLLQHPYTNQTLGIDLLREQRPYIHVCADDKVGVIDHDWLLITRTDGTRSLHRHGVKSTVDSSAHHPDVVDRMDDYARAQMQAFQYVIRTNSQ
jgi:phosphoglycerol transferase MdoB-like AlkP superfamily enzyme